MRIQISLKLTSDTAWIAPIEGHLELCRSREYYPVLEAGNDTVISTSCTWFSGQFNCKIVPSRPSAHNKSMDC